MDKVQKIREEVEKIAKSINPFLPDEDGKNSEYEAGRFAMVTQIMQIIDSLQEEPVSNPIDFEKELYKAFGHVKDFTLGMRIAKWFYDMGKNSQEPVGEDLEEAAKGYAVTDEVLPNGKVMINFQVEKAFKAGAQWKLKQDQSTIELAEDHAMLAGMEKMKEQLMAKAVDGAFIRRNRYTKRNVLSGLDMTCDAIQCFKDKDKIKVLFVKED